MFDEVKLNNTLLTRDQSNFGEITAWCRSRTLITVVRHTCTTTVLPATRLRGKCIKSSKEWTKILLQNEISG